MRYRVVLDNQFSIKEVLYMLDQRKPNKFSSFSFSTLNPFSLAEFTKETDAESHAYSNTLEV